MKKIKTYTEIIQSTRRDWGNIKPYTRVERNRKGYCRKVKHKSASFD